MTRRFDPRRPATGRCRSRSRAPAPLAPGDRRAWRGSLAAVATTGLVALLGSAAHGQATPAAAPKPPIVVPPTTAPSIAAAGVAPSALPGRPPVGPLIREDPRRYDVQFEVLLSSISPYNVSTYRDGELVLLDGGGVTVQSGGSFRSRGVSGIEDPPDFVNDTLFRPFELDGAIFVMPVASQSTYHRTELESLAFDVAVDGVSVRGADAATTLEANLRHGTFAARVPVPAISDAQAIRLRVNQRSVVWRSVIDDAAAARLPWPATWPAALADALVPEPFIESQDPRFRAAINEIFGADVTSVSPYIASKRIVAWAARNFRSARPEVWRGPVGAIDGLQVIGAVRALDLGYGSAGDFACICVALHRAAGIPARPVIGVTEREDDDDPRDRETFDVWVEFYLDGAGWVPFDPEEMLDNGSWRNRPETARWPSFGTWDDLHDRIPLAYAFSPRGSVAAQRPAVYGWLPAPEASGSPVQYISIGIVSRGLARGMP